MTRRFPRFPVCLALTVSLLALGSGHPPARAQEPPGPRVLRGHSGAVAALAFAPDGQTLASGGFDKTIRLWDPATGQVRRVLQGSRAEVLALAYAPDGSVLVSSGDPAGPARRPLNLNAGRVDLIGSNVGRVHPFWGDATGTVRVWDPASGAEQSAERHEAVGVLANNRFLDLDFGPGGKMVVLGGEEGSVSIWDLAAQRVQLTLPGHSLPVQSVAFAPDGQTVASASWDRTVTLWNVAEARQERVLIGHQNMVTRVR